MNRYYKKSEALREIARQRISSLFQQAKQRFKEESRLSNRYVELARKISMKYKVPIPSEFKRRFCKSCHKYLVPSVNCRVRLYKKRIIRFCLSCKHYMRHPYK